MAAGWAVSPAAGRRVATAAARRAGRRAPPAEIGTGELTAIRAALAAGASPAAALTEASGAGTPAAAGRGDAGPGALAVAARAARLGVPLAEVADRVPTDGPARLLVRALALAERAGVGGAEAVDQVLAAVRDRAALDRLLRVRTAQARVSARVLVGVPLLAWVLLTALDPGALAFYGTVWGLVSLAGAAGLLAGGWLWSSRLVRRAATAGERADPLAPRPGRARPLRGLAVGLPVALAGFVLIGPVTAVSAGAGLGWAASRPEQDSSAGAGVGGGAAEACELVAIALDAGLAPAHAVALCTDLAPPAARRHLAGAARRLAGGWDPTDAFGDGPLAALGAVLAAGERWGAPSAEPVRRLAADLRAERRAAAEEAVERVQVALVFPTTLLTLPAFVVGVVPPVLWSAFGG